MHSEPRLRDSAISARAASAHSMTQGSVPPQIQQVLTTESVPEEDLEMEVMDKVDDFLFTSPFTKTTFYKRRRENN